MLFFAGLVLLVLGLICGARPSSSSCRRPGSTLSLWNVLVLGLVLGMVGLASPRDAPKAT